LKKKRPPNYYKQEYQQMLEPSTRQYQQYLNQNDERSSSNEPTSKVEQNANDAKFISCNQWVDSTMKHQHDDKQSTNDEDEIDSDGETSSKSRQTTPMNVDDSCSLF
jgi:hypothetical protein